MSYLSFWFSTLTAEASIILFYYFYYFIFAGKIFLVGGLFEGDSNWREICDGRVEVFNTLSSKWDYVPSLKEPRYNHEAVMLST